MGDLKKPSGAFKAAVEIRFERAERFCDRPSDLLFERRQKAGEFIFLRLKRQRREIDHVCDGVFTLGAFVKSDQFFLQILSHCMSLVFIC